MGHLEPMLLAPKAQGHSRIPATCQPTHGQANRHDGKRRREEEKCGLSRAWLVDAGWGSGRTTLNARQTSDCSARLGENLNQARANRQAASRLFTGMVGRLQLSVECGGLLFLRTKEGCVT